MPNAVMPSRSRRLAACAGLTMAIWPGLGRAQYITEVPVCAPRPTAKQPEQPGAKPTTTRTTRRFAHRGVFEFGGLFGFAYDLWKQHEQSRWTVDADLYVGYFVTKYFVVGAHFDLPYRRFKDKQNEENGFSTIEFGLLLAPGFAYGLTPRVFVFVDGLIGPVYVKYKLTEAATDGTIGAMGGEVGLKFLLGTNYLVRVSFRPLYHHGRLDMKTREFHEGFKVRNIYLTFNLGFSGFL